MIYEIIPVLKEYLWAGNKLKTKYNKNTSLDKVSESFEFSVLKDNESIIIKDNKIIKLSEILPNSLTLIKLIDSSLKLSLQVHPSDSYAKTHYNKLGKTECWYIIESEENSYIYLGFNKDYTKEEIELAIKENRIEELLNKYYVKPRDFFYVPSGTVHSIGEGITLYEIQESSDLTFRLFDYNRKDKNGNLRELHIKESIDVLNYNKYIYSKPNSSKLIDNEYFSLSEIEVNNDIEIEAKTIYQTITNINGSLIVNGINVSLGKTYLIEPNTKLNINGNSILLLAEVK